MSVSFSASRVTGVSASLTISPRQMRFNLPAGRPHRVANRALTTPNGSDELHSICSSFPVSIRNRMLTVWSSVAAGDAIPKCRTAPSTHQSSWYTGGLKTVTTHGPLLPSHLSVTSGEDDELPPCPAVLMAGRGAAGYRETQKFPSYQIPRLETGDTTTGLTGCVCGSCNWWTYNWVSASGTEPGCARHQKHNRFQI